MRDPLKTSDYFKRFLSQNNLLIEQGEMWLTEKRVAESQITSFKKGLFDKYFFKVIGSYSSGVGLSELRKLFASALNYMPDAWDSEFCRMKIDGRTLKQYYLFTYDEMLWMLSLGYLLNISEADFKKLIGIIDRDQVKDKLFEFVISAKIKSREPLQNESYEQGWVLFSKLRQATEEPDKAKASKLVKEFLEKDWYKEHKDVGWHNSHKSKHDIYFGYWSFESAAVVKIKGLDDSSFRDNQYYPKDLLHITKDI